jgi:hypothetical protein
MLYEPVPNDFFSFWREKHLQPFFVALRVTNYFFWTIPIYSQKSLILVLLFPGIVSFTPTDDYDADDDDASSTLLSIGSTPMLAAIFGCG